MLGKFFREFAGNKTPTKSSAPSAKKLKAVKSTNKAVAKPKPPRQIKSSPKEVTLTDDFDFSRFTICLTSMGAPLEVSERDRTRVAIISDDKGASCTDIIIVNAQNVHDRDLKSSVTDLRQRLIVYREKENLIKGHEPKWMRAQNQVQVERIYNRYESSRSIEEQEIDGAEKQLVEKKIEELLVAGIEMKASDIHIEIREKQPAIRFRVNGDLVNHDHALDYSTLTTLSNVCFQTMCEMKGATYLPGSMGHRAILDRPLSIGGELKPARLRFQSIPHGSHTDKMHDLVLRVLPVETMDKSIPLTDLGYTEFQARAIDDCIREANGLICFAGTTGSGKTTSIASCLIGYIESHTVNGVCGRKVITVEDPIEFEITKATQVAIPEANEDESQKELRYAAPISDALRSDPDFMMISEVREKAAAGAMKKAVQSGHPCMTTVHSQSAIGITERLEDIGVPLDTLGSPDFINIFIFQGLAQTLCDHCKMDEEEFRRSGTPMKVAAYDKIIRECEESQITIQRTKHRFRNMNGCSKCPVHSPGVCGRTVVAEIFKPDLHAKTLIRKRELVELQKYWLSPEGLGGMTFKAHAFSKIELGTIDPVAVAGHWGKLSNV